jgi:hypothetical protein
MAGILHSHGWRLSMVVSHNASVVHHRRGDAKARLTIVAAAIGGGRFAKECQAETQVLKSLA